VREQLGGESGRIWDLVRFALSAESIFYKIE